MKIVGAYKSAINLNYLRKKSKLFYRNKIFIEKLYNCDKYNMEEASVLIEFNDIYF